MRRLSKVLLLGLACSCLGATWMASPGKGSHASGVTGAAFRSISSTTYASRTNTTITAPTGITNGDILILAFIAGGSPPVSATLPAGFTIIQGPTQVSDGTFAVERTLAWKLASGEAGDYTVTNAAGSTEGMMICVSGAANVTPVSSSNQGSGTTTTATGITTPSNNALVAFIVHNWQLYGTASPPTGTTPTFTERLDSATSLMYVATGVLATAGATGDKTQANLNGGGSDQWGAFLISVGP